jgi:hypothetical protein
MRGQRPAQLVIPDRAKRRGKAICGTRTSWLAGTGPAMTWEGGRLFRFPSLGALPFAMALPGLDPGIWPGHPVFGARVWITGSNPVMTNVG